jgi:poly(3-hydroxybutyrate) depolymerase
MVVMLHGCTQTAAQAAAGTKWNTLADEHRFVVVYPQQSDTANPLSCWPRQFMAILRECVSERRKVLLTWENEGVEANILP